MPRFRITDTRSGQSFEIESPQRPSDSEVTGFLDAQRRAPSAPVTEAGRTGVIPALAKFSRTPLLPEGEGTAYNFARDMITPGVLAGFAPFGLGMIGRIPAALGAIADVGLVGSEAYEDFAEDRPISGLANTAFGAFGLSPLLRKAKVKLPEPEVQKLQNDTIVKQAIEEDKNPLADDELMAKVVKPAITPIELPKTESKTFSPTPVEPPKNQILSAVQKAESQKPTIPSRSAPKSRKVKFKGQEIEVTNPFNLMAIGKASKQEGKWVGEITNVDSGEQLTSMTENTRKGVIDKMSEYLSKESYVLGGSIPKSRLDPKAYGYAITETNNRYFLKTPTDQIVYKQGHKSPSDALRAFDKYVEKQFLSPIKGTAVKNSLANGNVAVLDSNGKPIGIVGSDKEADELIKNISEPLKEELEVKRIISQVGEGEGYKHFKLIDDRFGIMKKSEDEWGIIDHDKKGREVFGLESADEALAKVREWHGKGNPEMKGVTRSESLLPVRAGLKPIITPLKRLGDITDDRDVYRRADNILSELEDMEYLTEDYNLMTFSERQELIGILNDEAKISDLSRRYLSLFRDVQAPDMKLAFDDSGGLLRPHTAAMYNSSAATSMIRAQDSLKNPISNSIEILSKRSYDHELIHHLRFTGRVYPKELMAVLREAKKLGYWDLVKKSRYLDKWVPEEMFTFLYSDWSTKGQKVTSKVEAIFEMIENGTIGKRSRKAGLTSSLRKNPAIRGLFIRDHLEIENLSDIVGRHDRQPFNIRGEKNIDDAWDKAYDIVVRKERKKFKPGQLFAGAPLALVGGEDE